MWMTTRRILLVGAITLSSLLTTGALGQSAVTYKLGPEAQYQEGCFDPCLCPIMVASPVTGTFRLKPITNNGTVESFEVSDIAWAVSGIGEDISGEGTYTLFNEFANLQRMQLNLMLHGSEQKLDSGTVLREAEFPLINVTVSINGMYCYDTAITVEAHPVKGDVNGDAYVNVDDLLAVVNSWGPCSASKPTPADIAPMFGNGYVNVDDLLMVINHWRAGK